MGFEPTTLGTTNRCSNQLSYSHHVLRKNRVWFGRERKDIQVVAMSIDAQRLFVGSAPPLKHALAIEDSARGQLVPLPSSFQFGKLRPTARRSSGKPPRLRGVGARGGQRFAGVDGEDEGARWGGTAGRRRARDQAFVPRSDQTQPVGDGTRRGCRIVDDGVEA